MSREVSSYLNDAYSVKRDDYYTSARRDFVADLPHNPNAAILELGCGNGATGALALEQGKCGTYVGIEMFEPMAQEAMRVLTAVHVGNVETMEIPYAPGTFDALICSEVLEHLVDPEPVLRKLVALLKPGGLVFASSPNIAHWRIILGLVRGKFEYEDFGVMDRTHLRWFTPASYRALFEAAGVEVVDVSRHATLPGWKKALFGLLGKGLGHLTWYQIEIRGKRAGGR
ncbi:MAG: class I SAM-dependent methyltransferase [Sphingomonas sp.]|uniref:class I SAM-dependent methyltransferase n=1 Tax=Sphingomonas sp. TaxID=28214 RepID=UPI001B1B0F98|nr:class I SAM-dependent methyltransferase [Sphingomonas sp.]MBO9622440.1 class I SAM-dependent methyltransferase [Sphingomonas sp.]